MLVVGLNFALPLIRKGYKEGIFFLLVSGILTIACAFAVIFLKLSVIIVILGAATLGTFFFSSKSTPPLYEEEQGEPL